MKRRWTYARAYRSGIYEADVELAVKYGAIISIPLLLILLWCIR